MDQPIDNTRRGFLTSAALAAGVATGALVPDATGQTAGVESPAKKKGGFSKQVLKDIANTLLAGATSDQDHERILIRYTRGTGQLSQDRAFIALQMSMFGLD